MTDPEIGHDRRPSTLTTPAGGSAPRDTPRLSAAAARLRPEQAAPPELRVRAASQSDANGHTTTRRSSGGDIPVVQIQDYEKEDQHRVVVEKESAGHLKSSNNVLSCDAMHSGESLGTEGSSGAGDSSDGELAAGDVDDRRHSISTDGDNTDPNTVSGNRRNLQDGLLPHMMPSFAAKSNSKLRVGNNNRRMSLARNSSVLGKEGLNNRRGTLRGSALQLGLGADPPLESSGNTLRRHWEERFGAVEIDRRFESPGIVQTTTREEYYMYYSRSYTKQWRMMDLLAILVALFFTLTATNLSKGIISYTVVKGLMFLVPSIELGLSFWPSFYQRHGLLTHMVVLFIYGCLLACMELWLYSLNVPSYLILYLMLNYTNICQPSLATSLTCCIVSLLDLILLFVAIQTQPELKNLCYGQSATLSCERHIIGNALIYLAINAVGIAYNINNWNYTRKTFLNNRELFLRKRHFEDELKKAEFIALSVLPKKVWDELKGGHHQKFNMDSIFHKSLMYHYSNVTVLFADIVGFTALSGTISAAELVKLLNSIFFDFDLIVDELGIEKIKTIGDCYMIVAGGFCGRPCLVAPEPVEDHELKAVIAGLRMIKVLERVSKPNQPLAVRVGIHTGDVHAGLIGEERCLFDVFSNDVAIASMVEQTGRPNQVHISHETFVPIMDECTALGAPPITIFGKTIPTYFVSNVQGQADLCKKQASGTGVRQQIGTLKQMASSLQPWSTWSRARASNNLVSLLLKDTSKISLQKVDIGDIVREQETEEIAAAAPRMRIEVARPVERDAQATESLLKLVVETSGMNLVTCRFNDIHLEQDYQDNYVSRCQGKMLFAMLASLAVTLVLFIFDYVVFYTGPVSTLPKFVITQFMIVVIEALGVTVTFSNFLVGDTPVQLSPKVAKYVTQFARIAQSANYHVVGSLFTLAIFASRLIHEDQIPSRFDFAYNQMYPVMAVTMLWTRLSAMNMTIWLMACNIVLMTLLFVNGTADTQTKIFVTCFQAAVLGTVYLVMRRMEIYIRRNFLLKRSLAQKQFEIEDIRLKSERLLFKLLPRAVVNQLKIRSLNSGAGEIAETVESAGIMFCTICHFKEFDRNSMMILNDIICKFDGLLAQHDVEKIKTIGSIYMCSSGLGRVFEEKDSNEKIDESHIASLADFALGLKGRMQILNKDYPKAYNLRIGMHIGPILAGIIGKTKFAYDVWGDTVNVASRMDSTGAEDRIQVTERVYNLLKGQFKFEERGLVKVKGKGELKTYFLVRRKRRSRGPNDKPNNFDLGPKIKRSVTLAKASSTNML